MQRVVTSEMDLPVADGVDMIFQIAVHSSVVTASETLTFTLDGVDLPSEELIEPSGNRLHRVRTRAGSLHVAYRAVIDEPARAEADDAVARILYLRPSRYAESDAVFGQARRQFAGLAGAELLAAVRAYVAESISYAPDGTVGTDSAVTTLASGRGVCRDFAHSVIALLRAMDVPARYAACYAPGLRPMDFHALAEAWIDDAWHVVDATGLSDRASLVRIGIGRDASDCAWLSFHGGYVGLDRLRVDAWIEGDSGREDPAPDDGSALVVIG